MSSRTRSPVSTTATRVRVRTPVPRRLWEEVLAADVEAMPTQSPAWIDCLCATGRFRDATRMYEMPDGSVAVLPLVRAVGATAHSMPQSWGYGGLISAPGPPDALLATAVLHDLASVAARIHLRPNPIQAQAWSIGSADSGATVVPARAHILDLGGGFETVWRSRFKSSVRREVRRAEEGGVIIGTDSTGAFVPIFYELLRRSFDRWAARQGEPGWLGRMRGRRRDPLSKFQIIADVLEDRCQISLACYRGRPIAAILVLRGGAVAHYTRGAMDTSIEVPVKVNSLLHKTAIEYACRDGCLRYHMGDSGFSAGLAQFKTRFGAQQHDFAEYWLERLPVFRAQRAVREAVKSAIGFRDA
ncbi:GNAT family N-acetyltransferase [Mycolicibacterium austroafricanum]|uniref:GNAT family N-acetyltransferase n=1 Tax=Mycolicibacterium austroafricanum TaxID=39687 RepID=UPI001CA37110|nr:GNAT family N-acetyltransferase [Mycolicibacterium austroafricanum]QZT62299.1 GNAT family N-acetyltransferase [Mycolicibacterium austroafricanum]